MDAAKPIALEIRNKDGFPLPGIIQGIMWVVFSFPLIVIPMTFSEVAKNPKVLFFWVAVCIPLAVMFTLRRLFTRFRVTLFADGSVKITQPFNSQNIAREQLAVIVAKSNNAHVGGSTAPVRVAIPWLYFFDASHKQLARVSPAGFDAADVQRLLNEFGRVRPDVRIEYQ
jgi:hypothetical protein